MNLRFVPILANIALAACTTVPLTSIPQLARIDFMTTDLARMRIAMALPDALQPRPGGVQMDIKIKLSDLPERSEVLLPQETNSPEDMKGLPPDLGATEKIHVYKLSASDVRKLELIRDEVKAAQSAHKRGSLAIGISAKDFCLAGKLPDGPALSNSYLFSSENQNYVTLSQNADLRAEPTIAKALSKLEACDL